MIKLLLRCACAHSWSNINREDFYSAYDDLKEQLPALPWEARFAYYGVYGTLLRACVCAHARANAYARVSGACVSVPVHVLGRACVSKHVHVSVHNVDLRVFERAYIYIYVCVYSVGLRV